MSNVDAYCDLENFTNIVATSNGYTATINGVQKTLVRSNSDDADDIEVLDYIVAGTAIDLQDFSTMELAHIIDTLIGIVVAGTAWFISGQSRELKRVEILLNKTREEYATRDELRDDMRRVMEALHRVEDKLDKVLSR